MGLNEMKMTVKDITEAMTDSHDGFTELVTDSVSFRLGRPLTDEEHLMIYNITECAIYYALNQLKGNSENTDKSLTPEQFNDLADYLYCCGVFSRSGGIQGKEFLSLTVIDEPTDEPDGRKIYLRDSYPFAVYDFDTGFTILRF
ncbi:hypothetical protein CTZ24_23850 (plasmid) [Pantoea phytobeneficialis]|uniref:Uncharacterized protein n=2 Tax=Pantoea phytobeneficialis TaxID=2052056 RepID=A0AAP9KRX4_9GAMM|nr:hypothetical protein CTZ24_23850 [Pantoea phytobeneficialis]